MWDDATLAYLLDKPYLAMRAEDVLTCARFLARYEAADEARNVHLVSIGRVGPPALHAAALEPQLFAAVELKRCLASWSHVVREPWATHQYENVVHGALKAYDLPDLLRTLPENQVTLVEPLDARQQPIGAPGS